MSAQANYLSGSGRRVGADERDSRTFRTFAWLFVVLALGSLVVSTAVSDVTPETVWQAAFWAAITSVAGLVPVKSDEGPYLSLDLPLLLGAGFVFGPAIGGIVAFVGATDIRELRRDISVCRGLFNRTQTATCVALAAAAFHWAGGDLTRWPFVLLPALLALSVDCVVNYTLVASGTALRMGTSFRAAAQGMRIGSTRQFLISYLSLGLLSLVFGSIYLFAGIWGLAISVVPLVLAWQSFSRARELEEAGRIVADKARALRKMSSEIVSERRDERTRIAASLHDDVLQSLYNVALHTHVIREDLRGGRLLEMDDDLPALVSAAEAASDGLRAMIRNVRQSPLGRAGLEDTLHLLIRDLQERSKAELHLKVDPVSLGAEEQLLVYQIAREALTNSCKHAEATSITVRIASLDGYAQVSVEDDGSGFDPSVQLGVNHFGLQMMRERAEVAGGYLRVDSAPGSGTTVLALIPMSYKK